MNVFVLTENKKFIDEDGNVYIMTKDPKTGKMVKKLLNKKQTKKKGPAKKANMTKEEKANYKAGKRNEDSDSDYSYRSVYSPGGTRHVHRRKRNADGTYGSDESYHSSQDEDGEARRRRRRRDRDHEGSAHSYYSVTSPGGTRQVRKKKRHADGTYSDSESCKSSDALDKSKGSEDKDGESDYSIHSEVSDGGTRTVTKKKRIRDELGNVIGYGDPVPVDPEAMLVSDTGSISPRRGSISDGSEGAYDRYMANKLQQLDDIADQMDADKELEKEKEEIEKRKREEMNRLKERVFDPTWAGTKPTDKPDIPIPNFDDQIKHKEKRGASREKMGGSRGGKTGPLTSQDLANMTEEERVKYFEEQEKKKQEERERQRKEKEKREKKEKLNMRRELTQENIEKERERLLTQEGQNRRRESVMSQRLATPNGKPQSMVTYEKGTGRDINTPIQKSDNRQTGLSHSDWARKPKDLKGSNRKQRDSTSFDYQPTKLNSLNRKFGSDKKQDENNGGLQKKDNNKLSDLIENDKNLNDNENDANKKGEMHKFDFDENGNIRLKPGQKLDLNKLTDEDLIKLGIDPSLPKSELLKKLREKLGKDITIMEGDEEILDENCERDEDSLSFIMEREKQLAKSKDITGVRRVNLLLRHGGSRLQVHMQNIVDSSNMNDYNYATDLDERDSAIDFMCHYRLVNPSKLDSYAKAFVVEDSDLDTVITFHEIKTALDGVPSVQHITNKQVDYVFKVLHIDDATLITFRMFAVITALCERVTEMDPLSKHLMELCNLADIERKLNLYQAMFYHNIPADRNTNFITSDSLKIELIAGGLNWKQQKYIMEKMEPNDWGEISFIDYMCYIPLFMSMHDNICENPLDMSDTKYQMPPRKRPPSVQRDMNPLGQPLSKNSTFLLKKQARDMVEGKIDKSSLKTEKIKLLEKYAKLPEIPKSRESKKAEDTDEEKMDLIY